MTSRKKSRFIWLLIVVSMILFLLAVANGAAEVTLKDLWLSVVQFDSANQAQQILRTIRLPRVLGAFVVGSSFALSAAIVSARITLILFFMFLSS